jgi:uracil-DNA glycosylase
MADSSPIIAGIALMQDILLRSKARGVKSLALEAETIMRLRSLPEILSRHHGGRSGGGRVSPEAGVDPPSDEPVGDHVTGKLLPGSDKVGKDHAEAGIRQQLRSLFEEISADKALLANGTLLETVVYSSGNPMADLLFVGEAPGEEEELQRKPFVGPAGQKLMEILKAMGLRRQDVYITNVLKRRPKINVGKFQQDRTRSPDPAEMELYLPYLKREINLVAPKLIVALGVTAAEGLLERGSSIASLRGHIHEFEGYPLIVTYHPSFLLRVEKNGDEMKGKRAVWADMLTVMEMLKMPISEKQRGYFQAKKS